MKLSLFSPFARQRAWLLGVPGLLLTGAALASQQSDAKGFVEDGDLTLLLRNYYYLRQNEGDGHGAAARNSRDPRSWTQAFLLNYTSGFTQGTVGVGVDAYGYLGLKLDGGDGHANTPNMPVDGAANSARAGRRSSCASPTPCSSMATSNPRRRCWRQAATGCFPRPPGAGAW